MEKVLPDQSALAEEARVFVLGLTPAESHATLVTLSGELGAGKTAFVKAAAQALGVDEVVNSPTFVLEKIYDLPASRQDSAFKRLIHIDAYRLEKGADLEPLGFDMLMKSAENLIMLEWPERVADALPAPQAALTLTIGEGEARTISYGA